METLAYYQRYRPGDHCPDCSARRYTIDAGKKYCENGHQDLSFTHYDVDLDDQFGKLGRITRKKKEARKKVYKHLAGSEGDVLYLVCLQLILRKQVQWLIANKGLDPELERVCKALWELRVRKFPCLRMKQCGELYKGNAMNDGFSSQTDTDLTDWYSSQAESSQMTNDEDEVDEEGYPIHLQGKSRVRDWSGRDALPKPSETLAILYLASALREEPLRIGDIFKWAKNDQLPYLGAIDLLPIELRERLPIWAQRLLLTRYVTFRGSETHHEVMTLLLGYKKNYDMVFPKIPIARPLLQYIQELALPPHVHRATQEICDRADLEFTFPTKRDQDASEWFRPFNENKPHSLIELPDVLLVAAMVVAVKYMYPLDKIERTPLGPNDPLTLKMDWEAWESRFVAPEDPSLGRLEFENLDPQMIWTMSKDEMDEYLTWYENTRIDKSRKKHDETDIEQLLFPLGSVVEEVSDQDLTVEQLNTRMEQIQSAMMEVEPRNGDDISRIGSLYQVLRQQKHVKGIVKRFYEEVAEISGLELRDLVAAVYKVEMMLKKKDDQERKLKRMAEDPFMA